LERRVQFAHADRSTVHWAQDLNIADLVEPEIGRLIRSNKTILANIASTVPPPKELSANPVSCAGSPDRVQSFPEINLCAPRRYKMSSPCRTPKASFAVGSIVGHLKLRSIRPQFAASA
jgi:hypothetical protein